MITTKSTTDAKATGTQPASNKSAGKQVEGQKPPEAGKARAAASSHPKTVAAQPAIAAAKLTTQPQAQKPDEGSKAPVAQPGSGSAQQTKASGQQGASGGSTSLLPKSWEDIKVGSIVLSPAIEGTGYGWWEAVVTGITNDLLTLRWRDYPNEPTKARRRHEVGLLFAGE